MCYFYVFLSFFFLFLPLMTEKDEKTSFQAETNDFDQRAACRAPFCWSKYTTTGGVTETDSFLLIKKTEWKCPFVTYKKSTFTIIKSCPFYKTSAFILLTATAKTFRFCIEANWLNNEWDNRLSGISSIVGKQKKRVNGMDLFLFFSLFWNLFWFLKDFILIKNNFKN